MLKRYRVAKNSSSWWLEESFFYFWFKPIPIVRYEVILRDGLAAGCKVTSPKQLVVKFADDAEFFISVNKHLQNALKEAEPVRSSAFTVHNYENHVDTLDLDEV
jgi:hypothetical protein